jgi:hypothetical protein
VGPGAGHGEGRGPRDIALRPLYRQLQSGTSADTPELAPNGELRRGEGKLVFQGQDAELWARTFLADVDLFTSAPYMAGMKEPCPEALEQLLAAKEKLAVALAEGLDFVYTGDGGEEATAERKAAVEALAKTGRESLVAAYDSGPGSPTAPLRSHPSRPFLIEQSATATCGEESHPGLKDLSKWTYGLTYSHEHAAQDEVLLAVTFASGEERVPEATSPSRPAQSSASSDLAMELFLYTWVAPQLEEMMGLLARTLPTQTDKRKEILATVGKSAATLVAGVADAWTHHWQGEAPATVQGDEPRLSETRRFRIAVQRREDEDTIEALTLTLEDGVGPSPGGEAPVVKVATVPGELVELEAKEVDPGKKWRYEPRENEEPIALDRLQVRLEWPGLDVAAFDASQASLCARRNASLSPEATTNPAFVMSTAPVTTPATAALLEWKGEWMLDGELGEALTGALNTLFGESTGPLLTLRLAYRYRPAAPRKEEAADPPLVELPVALFSDQPLAPSLAQEVAEAAARWQEEESPGVEGASWLVSLTLSNPPPPPRPVFVLDRLVIPLKGAA